MSNFMKDLIKYSLTLFIVSAVAALILSPIYKLTQPTISKLEAEKNSAALAELFPEGKSFEPVKLSENDVTIIKDEKNAASGIAFKITAKGYGGPIIMLAGMNTSGYLKGIRVLSHNETPGLGGNIAAIRSNKYIWNLILKSDQVEKEEKVPWFQEQFKGLLINALKLVKNKSEQDTNAVQAITGATITSQSIVNSIKKTGNRILEELNKKDIQNILVPKKNVIKKWPAKSVQSSEASDYL